MLVLYPSGGAQEFEPHGAPFARPDALRILANAERLLVARGFSSAAETLRNTPFEIRRSYNFFDDDFCILTASLGLKEYERLRQIAESDNGRAQFRRMADVITELGVSVRVVVVEMILQPTEDLLPEQRDRALTRAEIDWVVRRYIGVSQGYLGDFSYRTHREFYLDIGLDINPYEYPGTTRERFESILQTSTPEIQARILGGIASKYPVGSVEMRTEEAATRLREFIDRLGGLSPVAHPSPKVTTRVVERALLDAEHLIGKQGATSAVDRMHTALHGYLLQVCTDATISVAREDSLPTLLKVIREQHPAFLSGAGRPADVTRILRGLGSVADSLLPLRNNASVAHPNDVLLEPPEAMLAINAARSILHYIDSRLSLHTVRPSLQSAT